MKNRDSILASSLVNYSTKVQKGEKVLIEARGIEGTPLLKELIKEVYKAKGVPFVWNTSDEIDKLLLENATEEQIKLIAKRDSEFMDQMDVYISVRANANSMELAGLDEDKLELYRKLYVLPVHFERRVSKKWVVLRYPTYGMAQASGMSLDDFKDFYYKVCNLDYDKLSKAMDKLVYVMNKTDKVNIKGNGTDLEFSIKGIKSIKCAGDENVPDGEVFTAPVKTSVNGVIKYNTPSIYDGFTFDNIILEFKDGKIIKATANNTEKINKILDTDDGARYIGEFALGVNPFITKPIMDTLFDEKIAGSFHFTPGDCYVEADNGNESSIHWDLVNIQTPECGGGEIYFDDVLIRKDGIFVLDELKELNPENYI